MFNRRDVEQNQEKFLALQSEANNLLKVADISYTNGDNFYREYSDFITTLAQTFEELQNYSQEQLTNYASAQEEAKARAKKDADFVRDADEFLRNKTQDLIKKNKFLEDAKAKMKEGLGNLDHKKVAKLKVNETPQLQALFQTIFKVFYKESNVFDWSKFKKAAVEKDKLDEFQNKLLNQDFTVLTADDINSLVKIKEDPWYDNYAKNDKSGGPIMELLNYFEYVKAVASSQHDANELVNEINKIKNDVPIKQEKAKSDANWAELLQQNITHLENLNARMVKSAEPFAQEASRTNEQATAFDKHKRETLERVQNDYASVQYVPRNIYADS